MEYKKKFKFEGIDLDYESLLNLMNNRPKFEKKYPLFSFSLHRNTYILTNKIVFAYIYKNPIKIIIQTEKIQESFLANSNLDIDDYCSNKKIDKNNLFFEDGENLNDWSKIISSDEHEIKLVYKEKKELTLDVKVSILEEGKMYKVSEYSRYYEDYFGFNNGPNTEFNFQKTNTREIIFKNLDKLLDNKCNKFKFTGPFNIGKSLTLLQYSRINEDVFYFNLKVLSNKSEYDCYMILIEEFSRINPNFHDTIISKISSYYQQGKKPLNLLYDIMKDLSGYGFMFIFIFDQFKSNSFTVDIREKFEKLNNNIKIVYCSSINNKSIRDECLRTWKNCNGNPIYLNINNQDFYFYYEEIYPQSFNEFEPIIDQIIKIKRFQKLFKEDDSDDKKIYITNDHINKKLKEYAEQNDVSLDFVLMNIKSLINKKYEIKEIEFVMEYCPLKYFVVKFINNQFFRIEMQFPFLKIVINRKLLIDEIDSYFKNEMYLKRLVENDTVKGNYFEEAAIDGLKHHIILPSKIDNSIEVKEIAKMEEINKNSYDYYYMEEYNQDDEFNEMDIESLNNYHNIIGSENAMDIEENNIHIENVIIRKVKNKIKPEKEQLNNFLKKYNIIENKYFSLPENSLEWHRKNEIEYLKEGGYELTKSGKNYDGNKTYFLEQRKRTGRTLDCGLLYGKEKEKIFIGFQIKCYFEETSSISDKATDKDIIKDNIKEILINSMLLLNCKITSWYYYLIFYYNPNKKRCNVSEIVIDKAKNVEVIYYNPLNKKFFDSEKKPLDKLELTIDANLDNVNMNFGMISLNLKKIYNQKCQLIIGKESVEKSFKEDFGFLTPKAKFKNIDDIIKVILDIMEVKDENYILKHKIEKLPSLFTFPSYDFIYLYKRKCNKGYLGVKTFKDEQKNEVAKFYDIKEKIEVDFFENSYEYLYTLFKKRKPRLNLLNPIPNKLKEKIMKK